MTQPASLHSGSRRVAIIGSGAAALGAAWRLSEQHHVTVFEKNAHIGGHANTVDVQRRDGGTVAVDTGFIVYNQRTYPNLIQMFDALKVPTQSTDMGFAVSLDAGMLEYAGGSLTGLFGQGRNLLRPRFWGMIADILRFYRQAPQLLDTPETSLSLGEFLRREGYGQPFVDDHLLPMAAAIWSAPASTMLEFPAVSFVRFCTNHGLLQLRDRPRWRTVSGGSREYVRRITAGLNGAIRLNEAVRAITRRPDGVVVTTDQGSGFFDDIVIGTHADEALTLLTDPSPQERAILGAFSYQENLAVLHSDPALMPVRKRVWSAWNYLGRTGETGSRELCVTYWMNRLQSLPEDMPLFVTLNPIASPDPELVHRCLTYHHPVFDAAAMTAQHGLASLQGQNRTWFCGSYFGYGFHEDAFSSGLAVAALLGSGQTALAAE